MLKLPVLQRPLSLRADPAAIIARGRIIRTLRPDVLHTHTAKAGATGRLAALAAGRARPGAVVHPYHGHVLSGYFSRRWERIFRLVERALALTPGAAVGEEVRDDLVSFGIAPARRFVVVPYGFELPTWSDGDDEARRAVRAEIGADESMFVVGWAGRLTAIKRPLDLVRTLRALVDRDVDTLLVLVGDGEDRADVEALAAELGVAERCRFVGYQRNIRPWLKSGETGYLEPIGDTAALAERLAALAGDSELRTRVGTLEAADVQARSTVGRMADELDAVYRRFLA